MIQGEPEQTLSSKHSVADEEASKRAVIHNHHLPTTGSFPFVPPKGWRSHQPLRKTSRGEYIDSKGRLWRKGPSRTEGQDWEWDVQLPNREHLNIDWGGNITHPKPTSRPKKRIPHPGLGGKGKKHRKRFGK